MHLLVIPTKLEDIVIVLFIGLFVCVQNNSKRCGWMDGDEIFSVSSCWANSRAKGSHKGTKFSVDNWIVLDCAVFYVPSNTV